MLVSVPFFDHSDVGGHDTNLALRRRRLRGVFAFAITVRATDPTWYDYARGIEDIRVCSSISSPDLRNVGRWYSRLYRGQSHPLLVMRWGSSAC